MNEKKLIGARIKAARERLDLTQQALADRIPGFIFSRLSNYETGYREPDLETLRKLARALECSVAFLIGDEDNLLSTEEKALLYKYRNSNRSGKDTIQSVANLSAPALGADSEPPRKAG